MSKSYDIFLSHSGAQKEFVEQLFTELTRQYGQYDVFFDKDSIKHGEPISSIILEYAKTCKLAVAVLSEEYLTRSKPPMLELAASYTASKNGKGVPCLLPVFLELKPEHAKSFEKQLEWKSTWEEWRRNEIMSDRPEPRTNRVEPTVWREALMKLLDTRGPVYKPHENRYKSALFAENVARVIAGKLDELSKTKVSYKAINRRDSASMEHLSKDFIRMTAYADSPHFDQMEDALTSGETHMEFERTGSGLKLSEREGNVAEREENVEEREENVEEREENVGERERKVTEREISINKRQRLVEVRETNVGERERKVKARETFVDERERNVLVRELERKENQGSTVLNRGEVSELHVWEQCMICLSQPISGRPYGDRFDKFDRLICPGPPPPLTPPFPDYSSLRDRSPHRGGPCPSPNSCSNLSFLDHGVKEPEEHDHPFTSIDYGWTT